MSEQDFATDADLRKRLREPFPANLITKLDKGFGKIDTLNHAVVTDRLNEAAPGWTTSEPQVITIQGGDGLPHVVAVVASMTIGGVTRWEVGEVERPTTYGDELKKAMSDFIKRAAMRFGVGIDLWSKEDLTSGRGRKASSEQPPPASNVPSSAGEPTGEGPAGDGAILATEAQWANLLSACGGKVNAAVSVLNDRNGTRFEGYREAKEAATSEQLERALLTV